MAALFTVICPETNPSVVTPPCLLFCRCWTLVLFPRLDRLSPHQAAVFALLSEDWYKAVVETCTRRGQQDFHSTRLTASCSNNRARAPGNHSQIESPSSTPNPFPQAAVDPSSMTPGVTTSCACDWSALNHRMASGLSIVCWSAHACCGTSASETLCRRCTGIQYRNSLIRKKTELYLQIV